MASYKLSPEPPGSDESHKIRSSIQQIQNLPIKEAMELAKQRATKQNVFFPESFGAKQLGKGAYGTVYLVRMTNELYWTFASIFQNGGGKIITQFPHVPSNVIIKITKQAANSSDSNFYQENVRENLVHKRFATASCLQIGTKPLCISKYVPKFFFSCIIGKPRNHRSVTVMEPAGNTDLDKFVRGKKIPAELFVDIERAICAMWLTGYIHGDLHRANIMIDTSTNSIKIIDFGFATKLPPQFVQVLSRRIYNKIARGDLDSLGDVWTQKPMNGKRRLINYTNAVMKSRGFGWYNPDFKILRTLWNQVPRNLRSQIPAIRAAAWGIPIGAKTQSKSQSSPRSIFQSPTLRASSHKTYRSSTTAPRGSINNSAKRAESAKRKEEMKRAESAKKKEELARQQSAKRKQEEIARQQSAKRKQEELARQQSAKRKEEIKRAESAKRKQEELARQQSAKRKEEMKREESAKRAESIKQQSAKKQSMSPKTPSTMFAQKPRAFSPSPSSRKFTNIERAAVYGRKGNAQKMFSNIERQKMMCRQRGMEYNPITKACTFKTPAKVFGGCREDCGKIGKKCGPNRRCIKL